MIEKRVWNIAGEVAKRIDTYLRRYSRAIYFGDYERAFRALKSIVADTGFLYVKKPEIREKHRSILGEVERLLVERGTFRLSDLGLGNPSVEMKDGEVKLLVEGLHWDLTDEFEEQGLLISTKGEIEEEEIGEPEEEIEEDEEEDEEEEGEEGSGSSEED